MSTTTFTIKGGTMFDAVAGAFRPNPGIVIDGGIIAQVGGAGERGDVIDASGKTVMPGLMNLHGHLAWDGFSDLEGQSRHDGPMGYVKVARGLISAVEAGVTTFRDLGGVHDTGLVARQAQRDGLIAGPKVITCGRAICRTGGHIWYGNREADGADDVRKATREQIRDGADWIKLMAHSYTPEELSACVEQAHDQGVPVTTDAGVWAELAVDAGVDCIEHGGDYSDELIATIVERGVWIVPTLSPIVLQAREGAAWGMKQSVIDRRRGQLADKGRHEGLGRARRAGAKLAFGTDSGSPVVPHGAILAEMQQLLAFGVFEREIDVLQAITIRGAELIRQVDRTGSLDEGKTADVVILGGDLAADITVIERVERVWVDGRLSVVDGSARLPDPRDFRTFTNIGA
ncbi:amidohydrolase family protein [soil metagenome]